MKEHDAQMLSEHFIGEQEKNEYFFFMIEADDDDRLKHCFWDDPTSRRAYKFDSDVVVFDTTYNTNRVLAQQRHEEIIVDHVDINEQPMLKSPLIMEKQMAVIYTRKIFYKFQKELWKCLAGVLQLAREDDNLCFNKVMDRKKDGSFKLKVQEVMVDKVAVMYM
ncbi:hypothetical protein L3X38_029777 [Prunus dulcis]|uniref:Protein FAR1-RELATED SEQUENCE n=1 Tax=Prunus dulcis TaxID=3755 RepID=A0AAD4VTT7_PRUDU|nr:hypothetical protein L3X38_029777 [Prunus dulcis]